MFVDSIVAATDELLGGMVEVVEEEGVDPSSPGPLAPIDKIRILHKSRNQRRLNSVGCENLWSEDNHRPDLISATSIFLPPTPANDRNVRETWRSNPAHHISEPVRKLT